MSSVIYEQPLESAPYKPALPPQVTQTLWSLLKEDHLSFGQGLASRDPNAHEAVCMHVTTHDSQSLHVCMC